MRPSALATDYDGTLATHGKVDEQTLSSLKTFVASGRQLLLITGRELPDLKQVFPHLSFFTRVVAENGALLYRPATGEEQLLCEPASPALAENLLSDGIPVSVGRAIVATTEPHLDAVRKAIRESGLDLHISLNKGSVMVLPHGVNKATGLRHALTELGLDSSSVVGIGDAENDFDFLSACGCAVAVANALPSLKSSAHLVTSGTHGAGVAEIIGQMLAGNLLIPADRG